MRKAQYHLTIVIPVFNEEANLRDGDVWRRLGEVERGLTGATIDYVFIDDGSADDTFNQLKALKAGHPERRVTLVKFTRNFGAWAAIRAGLERSRGDAVFIQTIDGEEPPELIRDMIEHWQQGADVVWLERQARRESLKNRMFARVYTALMQKLVVKNYPSKGVAVPLLDRRVVDFLVTSRERSTPLIPLLYWAGFKQTSVLYTRQARRLGTSGWTFVKLVRVFVDSFLAFTFFPIRMFSVFGAVFAVIGFLWALALVLYKVFYGELIVGYTSIMVTLLFFAGLQMVFMGVMGEYLWRILEQVKERPGYVIDAIVE